jgi:hypothetical protein
MAKNSGGFASSSLLIGQGEPIDDKSELSDAPVVLDAISLAVKSLTLVHLRGTVLFFLESWLRGRAFQVPSAVPATDGLARLFWPFTARLTVAQPEKQDMEINAMTVCGRSPCVTMRPFLRAAA